MGDLPGAPHNLNKTSKLLRKKLCYFSILQSNLIKISLEIHEKVTKDAVTLCYVIIFYGYVFIILYFIFIL